jgi:hypothetical protein
MLPDALVQHFTLQEGRACPAVSLYVEIDEATLELRGSRTLIEQVPIAHNLRHDQLEQWVTHAWLLGEAAADTKADAPDVLVQLQPELAFLHRLACALKERREVVRGKPETFNRPDYNFRLREAAGGEPQGTEVVEISTRQRGAGTSFFQQRRDRMRCFGYHRYGNRWRHRHLKRLNPRTHQRQSCQSRGEQKYENVFQHADHCTVKQRGAKPGSRRALQSRPNDPNSRR